MVEYKANVEINGKNYTLVTKEPRENINQIAEIFDQKIQEVKNDKLTFDRALILAGINITDDLYKLLKEYKKIKERSEAPLREYPKLVEEANDLRSKSKESDEKIRVLEEKIASLSEENKALLRKVERQDKTDLMQNKLREELSQAQMKLMDLEAENKTLKEKL